LSALKDIKDEDMGISIIVTGLVDSVNCCSKEAGLKRHSINYSLGIWGDKSKLPDEKYLGITTMCGHAMISFNLVKKLIEDIKKENVIPSGSPAEVNPINIGILEQLQNGVMVPSNAPNIFPLIPFIPPRIFLVLSGGK